MTRVLAPCPPCPPRLGASGVCTGQLKCGQDNFCVGVEHGKKYCYGHSHKCLRGQNTCDTDCDCKKYNTSSPKFTQASQCRCHGETLPNKSAPLCIGGGDWRADTCTCSPGSRRPACASNTNNASNISGSTGNTTGRPAHTRASRFCLHVTTVSRYVMHARASAGGNKDGPAHH